MNIQAGFSRPSSPRAKRDRRPKCPSRTVSTNVFRYASPFKWRKEYLMNADTTVKATAKYDRFRQFEVRTDDGVR